MRSRIALSLAMAGLLNGCGGAPDFDTRFEDEQARIEARVTNMQAELDARMHAAAITGTNAGAPPAAGRTQQGAGKTAPADP